MTTLHELRRRPHTSISALREYIACPRRFELHYIRDVKPAWKAAAASFGAAFHAVIGHWLTHPGIGQEELDAFFRDDLMARLESERIPVVFDDEHDTAGKLVDAGVRMLRVFLTRVPRPAAVLGVEVPFAIEVVHPKTGEVLPVPLVGALDAVVTNDGQVSLWEIKTARRKWSEEQVDHDLQVTVYATLAGPQLGYGGAPLRLLVATKTTHPDLQVENPARHPTDRLELLDVIFGIHAAIGAGAFHPLRSWACASCPYSDPCRP